MATEIILNERQWVEDTVSGLSLGTQPRVFLKKYAILLYSQGCDKPTIRRTLEDYILRCRPNANKLEWEKIIDQAVKECNKHKLHQVDSIGITRKEMETIRTLRSNIKERLMFTLLCLAKYRNAIYPKNNAWVNYELPHVYRLANIDLSKRKKMLALNSLYEAGMINFGRNVDNTNVRVRIISEDPEIAVTIDDFRNLGNQYMRLFSDNYMTCGECGIVIRRANNKHRLCKKCAEEMNRINTLRRYYEHVAQTYNF